MKHAVIAIGIAAIFAPLLPSHADEMQDIRNEIRAIKDGYEARLQALEDRLKEAEARTQKAEDSAAKAETAAQRAASAPQAKQTASQNAANPGIGLILSGFYKNLSQDPASYHIAGFMPSGGEIGPGSRGFSLSESELSFAANIDHTFYGQLTASLTPEDTVAVEEAFFKTLSLPAGLSVKGGRFFSGIGYLNEVHAHAWDFVDQPLAYQAFLGGQYGQNGLQLKWLAPTPLFLEFGVEAGNGQNFPGLARNKNGSNGGAVFGHVGGDLGDSASWRVGLSYLYHRVQGRAIADESGNFGAVINNFDGKSKLMIADGVLKWSPNGNSTDTSLKIQAEYFRRKENGDLVFDTTGDVTLNPFAGTASAFSSAQSGWYVQSVYQFAPQWRVGLRYDELRSGTPSIALIGQTDLASGVTISDADFSDLKKYNPKRLSAMIDWNPSEFSRIRLQYARDKARRDVTDNQFFVQYIYSLGAHGAHKY